MEELVREMANSGNGLTEGSVVHVLNALADCIAHYMAEGYSVTLENIGTFKAGVGVVKDKEMDSLDTSTPQRNARSIAINQVMFRADKKLIKETDNACQLKRGGISLLKHSPYTKEERLQRAIAFFHDHPLMRVNDYMQLNEMARTAATQELKELRDTENNGITASGKGPSLVYILDK